MTPTSILDPCLIAQEINSSDKRALGDNDRAYNASTHRLSTTYVFRIEYAIASRGMNRRTSALDQQIHELPPHLSIVDSDLCPNWSREFTSLGKHTLEQLSDIILKVLGWDRCHLYEFKIKDRLHAHLVLLDEDVLFVDAEDQCLSCDIPIRLLGLAIGDVFTYTYDFGDYQHFRVSVLDIHPTPDGEIVPALISCKGKNIIQYPGQMEKGEARELQKKILIVSPPEPARDRFRIRFITAADADLLNKWRGSNNRKHWQKAVAILESRNLSPETIANKIEQSSENVGRWIQAFNRFGMNGLEKPHGIREPKKSDDQKNGVSVRSQKARRVLEIVHAKPSAYGINRSNWSGAAIVQAYTAEYNEPISRAHATRLLRDSGYAIRKARKVLTSPDSNYREKVDLLLNTLQNLKPGELFFFVDEMGPLRVKKYGGRALVHKSDVLSYPQEQTHRGTIMLSGALNATTNQVTSIYSRAKDTLAMIDLMELLYNQYYSAKKLYVTWDAASWHRSALLVEWLDIFNATTRSENKGPIIELVPLPTSSQFLDVIEAVFSGMKRAVIHHSDYSGESEMKKAISLHFSDRNAHFRQNPRRAGKKIWEIDFFDAAENIRSGNYRKW